MNKFLILKNSISKFFSKSAIGHELLFQLKKVLGRLPVPDYIFPHSISLEVSSHCNLSCTHCPPHSRNFQTKVRNYNHMDKHLFNRLMDEIDSFGPRHIALHKDGEPLLHPDIKYLLERVKKYKNHTVYLSTNAHMLSKTMIEAILNFEIDIVNFSIGASSPEFYQKVRGHGYKKVIDNIHTFLSDVEDNSWKPRVQVQIINLPEYEEMKEEIQKFKQFWKKYPVEIQIWEKLNWGVLNTPQLSITRYPCYSLWKYLFVNSDGLVSVCCMDWHQKLIIGNANLHSLEYIWQSEKLKLYRSLHINNEVYKMDICPVCNYWSWLPKLDEYSISKQA